MCSFLASKPSAPAPTPKPEPVVIAPVPEQPKKKNQNLNRRGLATTLGVESSVNIDRVSNPGSLF